MSGSPDILEAILPAGSPAKSRLLTLDDLADMPEPRYLLHDFIRANGTNVLYGPSGSGKSFVALDWSLCIASGLPFYGQAVDRGPTVYIAAEGVSGYNRRAQAWCLSRAVEDVPDFRVYPEAVNFYSGDTAGLETEIAALDMPPVLITIDTMARCLVGGDENSAKDVGLFIDRADKLAKRFGAALLVIHHTGKNGEHERGSSALRAAADTMMSLKPDGASLKLTCEKQKESADFDPWRFHLEEKSESCVIRLGGDLERLSDHEQQILTTVSESFGTDWVSATRVGEVTGVPKTSLWRSLKALLERGLMEERPVGKRGREYRTKPDQATVPNHSKPFHETTESCSVPHPSLEGGTGTERERDR